MRTTIKLENDVAAAVERLRRARRQPHAFEQRTDPVGLRIDVSNVGEAIETFDGPAAR